MKFVIDLTVYCEGHSSHAVEAAAAMLRAAEEVAGEPAADWSLTIGGRTAKEMDRLLARRNRHKREKGESRG